MPSLESVANEFAAQNGLPACRFVSSGAFKETYYSKNAGGEEIAIKIFLSTGSSPRTSRELDAMKRCRHPGIGRLIQYLRFVSSGGLQHDVILEDFLGGGTLENRMANQRLSKLEIKHLLLHLADAIGYLRDQKLVHRDVKPANIMFRAGSGDPILVDLGIVRDLSQVSLTASHIDRGPGTPLYSSLEQLKNQKALIDWRSDQFALGVIGVLMVLGIHPYQPSSGGLVDAVNALQNRRPMDPRTITQLNAAGCGFLMKMAATYPAQRFLAPNDLISAIRNW